MEGSEGKDEGDLAALMSDEEKNKILDMYGDTPQSERIDLVPAN